MRTSPSLKRGLARVWKLWREKRYGWALDEVNQFLESRPDHSQLFVLRAESIQLQEDEDGVPTLDQAKRDLERAVDLDDRSPNALIELGYFPYAIEDDSEAASKCFQKAVK